jgi:biopolymer transport protein ExbB
MYYGNKKATPALDGPGTFDPDYTLVYHFDAATGAPPKDKTAYGNNAQSAPAAVDDGSVIGKGGRFTGVGPMLVAPNPSLAVAAGGAFTVSLWIKPDAPLPRVALVSRPGLLIGLSQGAPFVEAGGQKLTASTPVAKDSWSHVAVTSDGHSLTLYVNGKQAAIAPATVPAIDGPVAVGGEAPGVGSGATPYVGGMDELRLSKVARTAGLIAVDFASQGAESRLINFGADEKPAGIGFGLFGVIVKSVDGTAWVVIALLGVMSAVSWTVMVNKIGYANRSDRSNATFLRMFREIGSNITILADDESLGPERIARLRRSPLYRVYRAGAEEILRREERGQRVLRIEAIEVVRALMDATLLGENQKLAQGIVWLTIAISGGPFLGLLGTVIGVMLTFAAVAAAGDVNINAIAPGISAALLATVAGLVVAIPAMFGYNYILIRNKNITNNLHVFVDEFITKIAEYHSAPAYAEAAE